MRNPEKPSFDILKEQFKDYEVITSKKDITTEEKMIAIDTMLSLLVAFVLGQQTY